MKLSNKIKTKTSFKLGHIPWNKNMPIDEFKSHYKHFDEAHKKIGFSNRNKKRSEEFKENLKIKLTGREILWKDKISETMKLKYIGDIQKRNFLKEYRKKHPECVLKQSESLKQFYIKNPEKHPNRIVLKKGFISKPQLELFKIIKLWYNDTELEYPIKTNKHMYFGDVVIPSEKICIEYDSEYWHKNTKEKDDTRQKDIENVGYQVIRINQEQLNNLKENINIPLWRL